MKQSFDLSSLPWTVEGSIPYLWQFEKTYMGGIKSLDVPTVPARVPGSVQIALHDAGILPDWDLPLRARACEWVENRHWIYRTQLPDEWASAGPSVRLECLGLDYAGWIYVNNREAGTFKGTHIPHVFDLTGFLNKTGNILEIIFDLPPRWLGQFGYTSQMREWKTRFNYTWDWVARIVQVGIWDAIRLVVGDGREIRRVHPKADAVPGRWMGRLELRGEIAGGEDLSVEVRLHRAGALVRSARYLPSEFAEGIVWDDLPVELWWPNLEGAQALYTLTCRLLDAGERELDCDVRRVGFRRIEWKPCEGAPPEADPWVCVVNGRPVFLQGVNFAPIRALYADLKRDDYDIRLRRYRELGCNMLRLNACGFLEKECFYDLCDELGLLAWQEFPLTSSGMENWPPEDEASINAVEGIARSFVERRRHHACLALWSGGNELMGDMEGRKSGMGKPCGLDHPMLRRLKQVVEELDPGRRYIPTLPSGPRAWAGAADFGKGLHWDVHGPYAVFGTAEEAAQYWAGDDALFRAEMCCPGASPEALIREYAGEFPPFPATAENPYWNHPLSWWGDWGRSTAHGREPKDLAEYVAWSQTCQAEALAEGMKACKDRFPRCGGVLLWTGHDTFPIPINTSILDYEGNPKPAALALAKIWRQVEHFRG